MVTWWPLSLAQVVMEELPEECIREILCRLSDCRDLDSAGNLASIVNCRTFALICPPQSNYENLDFG